MKISKVSFAQIKDGFLRDVPLVGVWGYLIIAAIFYVLVIANLPTQNGDNIEHIHSSFLVAQGLVPYRDFFQHHNPLLWYLFAPLTKLFAYDTTITEIVCLISFLVFLKSLVYVYRIGAEFLGDKFCSLLATAMATIPGAKLYAVDFRPDNYMVFCLMGGIYYYFCYFRDKKSFQLIVAFIWFFLSFMFAQKALFPLLVLGVTGLYFWIKKDIIGKDMAKALIFPLVGGLCFLIYLYHFDMVELYFKSNYAFNLNLVEGFEMNKVVDMPLYMKILFGGGFVGTLMSLFGHNRYLKILVLMFVIEYFQRRFYFSPYSYYYWLAVYLAALCSVPFLSWLNKQNRGICLVIVAILYVGLYMAVQGYYHYIKNRDTIWYLPDYVTRRISPCDYVFNGDGMMYNIFGKDPAYYWQLIGQLDVVGEQSGIHPRPNINELIMKYRPKFVFGKNYFNKFSTESGRQEIVHYIDTDMIDKYYEKTRFYPIYQLKAEYNRKCIRDNVSGEWIFVD